MSHKSIKSASRWGRLVRDIRRAIRKRGLALMSITAGTLFLGLMGM